MGAVDSSGGALEGSLRFRALVRSPEEGAVVGRSYARVGVAVGEEHAGADTRRPSGIDAFDRGIVLEWSPCVHFCGLVGTLEERAV
jgi:hypothetical protein